MRLIISLLILLTLVSCGTDKKEENTTDGNADNPSLVSKDQTKASPKQWLGNNSVSGKKEYGLELDNRGGLGITNIKLKPESEDLAMIKKFAKLKFLLIEDAPNVDVEPLGDVKQQLYILYDAEVNNIDPNADYLKKHLLFDRDSVCHVTYFKAFTYGVEQEELNITPKDLLEFYMLQATTPVFKDPLKPELGFTGTWANGCPKDDVEPKEYMDAVLRP